MKPAQWWPREVPGGGHGICPRGAVGRHTVAVVLVQGGHPLAGECLGEADAVTAGLAYVGVVEQPVDGGCGQRFGHEFVKRCRVQIRADRDGAFLVGGLDNDSAI